VPKVVETERLRQRGSFSADLERPVEVAPAHGGPDLRGEYETVILPQPGLLHALLQLTLAVCPEGAGGPVAGVEDEAVFPVREGPRELPCSLSPCVAVEGPALAALRGVDNILRAPSANLAPVDAPLAVAAPACR